MPFETCPHLDAGGLEAERDRLLEKRNALAAANCERAMRGGLAENAELAGEVDEAINEIASIDAEIVRLNERIKGVMPMHA